MEVETPKIKNYDLELIISNNDKYPELNKETYPLAMKIQEKGVNVILTPLFWPRDSLFFHEDNTFTLVNPNNEDQVKHAPHWGWWGGAYLLGKNFIIEEASGIPSKRELTNRALGVEKGIYVDTKPFYEDFKNISVSGNLDFYKKDLVHIDPYFNLGNFKKMIFAWNTSKLKKEGKRLSNETGYDLAILPLKEAKFAAIGFIELGDHMVVDCRAEQTMKLLEEIGYNIISTPNPLVEVNKIHGSLRCITKETPAIKDRMKFHSFLNGYDLEGPAYGSIFGNLEGHMMVMNNQKTRKLREPLFPKNLYPDLKIRK